jgi:hypothetical protein
MRSASSVAAFAALIAATTASLPAHAASVEQNEAFQKQIFGRAIAKNRIHACYKRVYDAPHLASHPQQNVRTMTLLVTGKGEDPAMPTYDLGLGVTFRKSGSHFETYGSCGTIGDGTPQGGKANVVNCGVDCDGGSINVALKNEKSVLVSIPEGARIWKAGNPSDDEHDESRRFGSDDKLFRLDRTQLSDCLSLTVDDDEKPELRKGQ